MNISHSKVEVYNTCPYKYYLSYIERWKPDKTYTPLLFGSAIDSALNYVLIRLKHHHIPHAATAITILNKQMDLWHGQNELVFFKKEAPADDTFDDLADADKQWAVHDNLKTIGAAMIHTYLTTIVPNFKTILSVQTKRFIPNADGDNLVLITDFKAELHDGRVVTFDNKTSSDIKKYYGPKSVQKSQQLAIYTEFEPTRLAGYIALQKKIEDGIIAWKMVIDEIKEEQVEAAFDKVDKALRAIKREEFTKDQKGCFSFGRKCEMWDLCKKGSSKGLIKK